MSPLLHLKYPGIPLHLIRRGNTRNTWFHADDDYLFDLARLADTGKSESVSLHAYHLHALFSLAAT